MTPPMYDASNIVVWKARMSMYLKTLGLHVFLAATKKSYLGNGKHLEANAQALDVGPEMMPNVKLSLLALMDLNYIVNTNTKQRRIKLNK